MNAGPIFDRVYTDLKDQLMAGQWAPGAHLEPAAIGDDLAASVTPVRDALHRLVGERLVEAPRHDGFWVASLTETQLRGLYGWRADLLALAIRRLRCAPSPVGDSAAALFAAIAHAAGESELAFAVRNIDERLAPFHEAETRVLDGEAEELQELATACTEGDTGQLRRAVASYHRRRLRAAPAILAARHARTSTPP